MRSTKTMGLLVSMVLGCDPLASDPDAEDRDIEDTGIEEEGGEAGSSVGGEEGGEEHGEEGCSDGEPEPQPAVLHAYAMRHGDLPDVDVGGEDGGSGGDPTEGGIDPDAILVTITTGSDGCGDPWAAQQCGQWAVRFTLPADAIPGEYALADLDGFHSVSGPLDEWGECWWGGGSLSGDLSVQSIDDETITGTLANTDAFDFEPDGPFSAVVCP